MDILITGANGMLGEKCFEVLSERYSVIVTDLSDRCIYSDRATYAKLDITIEDDVIGFVRELRPDAVVNCAAYTDVDGAEKFKDIAWNVNVKGVENLIRAVEPLGSHLIHISTDYVFDGDGGPYKEGDPPNPVNYYGFTKLKSEELLRRSEIPHTIVRTNVLFGQTHYQQASFVHWVVSQVSSRKVIHVVNDQFGNPTWVDGLAEAIARILERKAYGLYHYGGKDYINRFAFALEIVAVFGLDPKFVRPTTTRALGQVAKRPYRGGLVVDKIKKELGVRIYSVREALRAMKEGQ